MAAKSIATGKLNTRVGHFRGHSKDEIAELSNEFDRMAEQLETLKRALTAGYLPRIALTSCPIKYCFRIRSQ